MPMPVVFPENIHPTNKQTNSQTDLFQEKENLNYRFSKMDAKTICDELLSNIKSSGLNFVLTETPFSVKIEIKKTFFRRSSKFSSKQCNLDSPSRKSQTMGSIPSSTNSKGFTSSFETTKPPLQKNS